MMKYLICILLSISFLPDVLLADSTTGEFNDTSEMSNQETLLSSLMSTEFLFVRPSSCPTCHDATDVNVSLNIIQILGFKESEEVLKLSGWFTFSWFDYRLTWNPADYDNRTCLNLPKAASFWRPDIGLINNVEMSLFDLSTSAQPRLKVTPNGVVTWLQGVILEVTCPLDVSNFPFDSQECYVIVTPWQSDVDQIVIVPQLLGTAVQNQYLPNSNISEWKITGMNHTMLQYNGTDGAQYQFIKFSIMIRRRPLYFVILVIIPFGLLSFLACLIFTLKEASDRLSVALGVLLSMTMYVAIVSSKTPKSMRSLPAICIYCLGQLIVLSGAIIWAVFTSKFLICDVDENSCLSKRKKIPKEEKTSITVNENSDETSEFLETCIKRRKTESFDRLEEQNGSLTNVVSHKAPNKSGKKQLKKILDTAGLVIYLILSFLNGWLCFIYLP